MRPHSTPHSGCAALAIALILLCACSVREAENRRPNVVLVVIDTLRPDHLGFYGHPHETAPFLAKTAAKSAVFTNAFSTSSWTVPAVASLFTGLYPTRHGVIEGLVAHEVRNRKRTDPSSTTLALARIADDVATLPEYFRRGGFHSFGIAANHNIGAGFGFHRGFDQFVRLEGSPTDARGVFEQVREWSAALNAEQPYFLYLHLNDPHIPYTPHDGHLQGSASSPLQQLVRQYDSEIGYADQYLGEIAELLHWDDSTVLAVVSDHGEEFEEHGHFEHRAMSLYGEVNRIVCLISAPAHGVRAQRIAVNISITDLLPTLLELARLPPAPVADGRSIVPLLRGEATETALREELATRSILAHRVEWGGDRQLWAVIRGRWKLITSSGAIPRDQLYDFAADRGELRDRSGDHPDVVASLREALADFRSRSGSRTPLQVELDANDLETLRLLGYVE